MESIFCCSRNEKTISHKVVLFVDIAIKFDFYKGKVKLKKCVEVIPKIIADNAGLDSLDIINRLRHRHSKGGVENMYLGVDIVTGVGNNYESFVW